MGAPRDEYGAGATSDVQVQVTLTRAFWMGEKEVTRSQWEGVGLSLPTFVNEADGPTQCTEADCPVVYLTFYEALTYTNRLSEKEGLAPCYTLTGCTGDFGNLMECTSAKVNAPTVYDCEGYRLPTEAEWEYAARAGTKTAYYTGDIVTHSPEEFANCYDEPNLDGIAWYCNNSGGHSHAVGQKTPNGWGLFDVLGNVFEFCNDLLDGSGYGEGPLVDPIGHFIENGELVSDHLRIVRGGYYTAWAILCKADMRMTESYASIATGLRVARTVPAGG